jgi:hypothetical protein
LFAIIYKLSNPYGSWKWALFDLIKKLAIWKFIDCFNSLES